jgi:tetratricopeptide (TPR) repeat protein
MTSMQSGFLSTDQVLQHIVQLLRANNLEEATSLYCRCQEDIGYPLINQVQGDPGLQQSLANLLYRARDYPKAALICENLGEFDKAAALYEASDDYYMAAEMFTKVGQIARAAEMFEKNQSWKQAADLFIQVEAYERAAQNFERAVNNYLAGKLYYDIGRHQKAMELLQKVGADAYEFFEATEMIADILSKNGYPELAARKLLTVLGDSSVDDKTVALFYKLAQVYAASGHHEHAKKVYQDVLSYDFNYKEASAALGALEELSDAPAATSADGPPVDLTDDMADPATVKMSPAPVSMDELPPLVTGEVVAACGEEAPPQQIVSMMEGFDFLKNLQLFGDLSLSDIKSFYNLCRTPTFPAGEVIVDQGKQGQAMHIIRSGEVIVVHVEPDGKTTKLATLGPGAHFGEMALIDDAPTSARVVATQETVTFEIGKEPFERFIFANDHTALRVYRMFVKTLCVRLRDTAQRVKA